MHDFAHRPIETALLLAAVVASIGRARAQDVAPPPCYGDVDAIAARALDARDPVTRGEAALWLADSQRIEHYQALLLTAADRAAPARLRGILAVGRLGAPGAESFLGRVLRESAPESAEAAVAAFALGVLDDRVPAPAIDALLERAQTGSRKRQLPLLSALLAGLATRPHPRRATLVERLRDDEVNRGDVLAVLAQAALDRAGAKPTPARLQAWLDDGSPGLRLLALRHWPGDQRLDPQETKHLVQLAKSDRDAAVRATALQVLARALVPEVLDLADRALGSHSPVEAATAARLLVALAGDARRAQIEARALDAALPAELRAALLDALGGAAAPSTLLACADTARDRSVPAELRVAAAACLFRAESSLAAPALAELFAQLDDPELLTKVARALHADGRLALAATRLTVPDPDVTAALVPHVHAVAAVDSVLGTELFLALFRDDRLEGADLGGALSALRWARVPAADRALTALLPEALAALRP